MNDLADNNPIDRRTMLTSMAAASALLSEAIADERNPAANVADRTSSIRIKSLTATPFLSKVFLKIETNHGVTGWGEIDQLEPQSAAALARSLFELLDGENPTRVEHLWQKLFRAHRDMRGGPFMCHTIAGIDSALWDIAGKLWGVPIYRLLGGPTRDKLRVYPSPKAQKIGAGPAPFCGDPSQLQRYVDMIQQARKKLGPDGTIMFDAHCALPPPFLIQLASAIEPMDIQFIEEPAVPGNIEVFKRLKQAIHIPLATGERDRTIWEVLPYLQEGCVDVLQVDCAHTGGISQIKKIATLGEAYHVPLAPHSVASELGVTASFHASAAIPFYLIHEYYPSITPPDLVKKSWSVDKEGYASLPEGPGLGVEINEKTLDELSKEKPKRPWKWPGAKLADGSIADY